MKKNINAFLIKNNFVCWTRLKTEKLLATAKQLIKQNPVCCLKNQSFFFTERVHR